MSNVRIPLHRPVVTGREYEYMADTIARGEIAGDGCYTHRCCELLQSELDVSRALLTTSCTHALEMAALLLDIGPGDEVIVPSFTFISTANAFALRGAKPVFADIRKDTLNIDETRLEEAITPRTRAIVPVHYGGIPCEMDAVLAIAGKHGVPVVEDNAQSLFARYHGKALGSFGALGALSFHQTKNITCGEGGALLISRPDLIERAQCIRQKGTNRHQYLQGQVGSYTWVDIGSSYVPSEILAAFLYAQLESRDVIHARRRQIWSRYDEQLQSWAARNSVLLQRPPAHCEPTWHTFYLLMPNPQLRQELMRLLQSKGISATFHHLPLHLSEMGQRFGGSPGQCAVAEWASECLLRLPLFFDLTEEEQGHIVSTVLDFGYQTN